MGDFVISPLPRLLTKELCAAGPLCSTGVAPFQRYYRPSRHRLVFDRFSGASGYAVYLAPSISRRDEDGFSCCLACPCHRTFSPVGLSPTEHASLRWTHSCPKTQTNSRPLRRLGPVANIDTKLLIYGLFQKGRGFGTRRDRPFAEHRLPSPFHVGFTLRHRSSEDGCSRLDDFFQCIAGHHHLLPVLSLISTCLPPRLQNGGSHERLGASKILSRDQDVTALTSRC